MPVRLSYPGVYVEEIPSGVHTITGVATSITAFIGRAKRGPVDDAQTINSYADFDRQFGGLWLDSTLGYAARDFYFNGGSRAIIVRRYKADDGEASDGVSRYIVDGLNFKAASPGTWGANLQITKDTQDIPADSDPGSFNLTIVDAIPGGRSERILNVSTNADGTRPLARTLALESQLVLVDDDPPSGKVTAVTDAEADVQAKQQAYNTAKGQVDTAGAGATDEQKNAETAARTALGLATQELDAAEQALTRGSDGQFLAAGDVQVEGALARVDLFNILCVPPYREDGDIDAALVGEAAAYCEQRRAMFIVDPPLNWHSAEDATTGYAADPDPIGTRSANAALFFPRLREPDPLRNSFVQEFVPCGAVAGIWARTDTERGVWKTPAGQNASVAGVSGLTVSLTNNENGMLNPLGINCLRTFNETGTVVWGGRTLRGNDIMADEWKYTAVRRTALFIEESLFRGTKWVVFEPNDEPLWSQIRLNVGAFMYNLFRQGAFMGKTRRESYLVKCDAETTTQDDIDRGIVNIVVGFAPLKPAEFVVISLQQHTAPPTT